MIVGADGEKLERESICFLPCPKALNSTPEGAPFELPRAFMQRKRAVIKAQAERGDDAFDAFSIGGLFFNSSFSLQTGRERERENLVSRTKKKKTHQLFLLYSPSRAPGSTRPRASRPRRRMRVRLWSRRAPVFVKAEGTGERDRGEISSSGPSKFGNASSRRRRRQKKKNVGLLCLHLLHPLPRLPHLPHLQVTEQQERVVDLHVKVVPASSLGHERAGSERRMGAFSVVVVVERGRRWHPRGRWKKKKARPFFIQECK